MDHKQLPNLVQPDRRSKPVFPWLTTVIDHGTRVVLASTLVARRPNTEIVVATFTEAVAGWRAEEWVGGKPAVLRTDNGSEFQHAAVAERLAVAGTLREFSEPFASRQNPIIERWHETIEAEFCKTMPAYHEGDKDESKKSRFGRKYGDVTRRPTPHQPPAPDRLPPDDARPDEGPGRSVAAEERPAGSRDAPNGPVVLSPDLRYCLALDQ